MERTPDVVVIGAGVIGLAVAYELSRRGARVAVIDSRKPGQGATHASAGMLAPHTERLEHPALHDLAVRSLDMYPAFVERVREDSDSAIEHRDCGSLHVAASEAEIADLRAKAAQLTAAAVSSNLLDPAGVRHLEPALADVAGALIVPSHGYVAVGELTRALVAAVGRQGVRIEAGRVLQIAPGSSGLRVDTLIETREETIHARQVVVAAGSWTSRVVVAGDVPVPVRPVRGQLLQLEWPTPPLSRIVWGIGCYLVPWTTGSVLVGATVEEAGFDERATAAGVHDLLGSACELLPRAWQAEFAGVRVGLRPATPDGLPVIGASARVPGVYYATGHFRNGVLLAPITALLLADLMLGRGADPLLDAFRPDRFR